MDGTDLVDPESNHGTVKRQWHFPSPTPTPTPGRGRVNPRPKAQARLPSRLINPRPQHNDHDDLEGDGVGGCSRWNPRAGPRGKKVGFEPGPGLDCNYKNVQTAGQKWPQQKPLPIYSPKALRPSHNESQAPRAREFDWPRTRGQERIELNVSNRSTSAFELRYQKREDSGLNVWTGPSGPPTPPPDLTSG
ncbi:hypothetical protein AXG93_285s1520 [Marchantia polymorpha subsp. ruderalis]|uniref:Uncharacterized protein n=1 Tax=Marchantia polymorpha subsp. ruderalis TaxID=1480154 RepID=A0A176VSX3_MARPO|nr:hypothetical protein AXG93_285s1520 [Marchantia polymorpha subsp. ruderalis]